MRKESTELVTFQDVGVLLIGYNRADQLKNRIDEILSEEIENLYISIDGGVASHTLEMEEFKEFAKSQLTSISNVHLNHEKNNLGLVKHLTGKITEVLSKHQYIIVIEDDVKISRSFLMNMLNGLNYLTKTKTTGIVSGFSPIAYPYARNKWRFGKYVYVWGWATSSDAWASYKYDLSNEKIEENLKYSRIWSHFSNLQRSRWLLRFDRARKNPFFTWDYQLYYQSLINNFQILVPLFSMTGNQGFEDERASHTKGAKPALVKNNFLNSKEIYKTSWFLSPFLDFMDKYYFQESVIIRIIKRIIR